MRRRLRRLARCIGDVVENIGVALAIAWDEVWH